MSTPQLPIYMDYSATTPVNPRVVDKMIPYLRESFGNPASHSRPFGWETEGAAEATREQVTALVNADPREIVWTSGTTESDNLAIKGAANFCNSKSKHIITAKTEYRAVLGTMRELERQDFEVTYLGVEDNGLIDIDVFKQAIHPDTILASVMMVNNEVGVIQDIKQLGKIYREKDVIFHADAAQVTGKVGINLQKLRVDLVSSSTYKAYGPKGTRALYVRRKLRTCIGAQMHGGGYERGMRSGTLAMHQIVGMGEAFRIAEEKMATENKRIRMLRDRLYRDLNTMEEVHVNGDMGACVPHNLNISFNSAEGESLTTAIKDVTVSSGSTYTSASLEPSCVLHASGHNNELTHSSIHSMVGRFMTEEEIDHVVELLKNKIGKLHDLSPLREMYKDSTDLNDTQWAAH